MKRLTPIGRENGTDHLQLAIGLPLRNQGALGALLAQIYDPASTNYHRYLTPEEFTAQFGPTEQDYQAVVLYAQQNGFRVTATHPNRMVLDVDAAVTDIERTFHVVMQTYQHPTEPRTFHAPDIEPTVDLATPILHISGLENYSLPHPQSRPRPVSAHATPQAGSGLGGSYRGNDFRAAYSVGSLTGAGQSVGLLQFDTYYPADITTYESQAGLPNVPLTNVAVDGGVKTPGANNSEVCLDIEMVMAMAPGVSRIYVYEAPNGSPWVDLLSRMANDNLSRQLSCSWGGGPPDATAEQVFLQMAAQGQSFFNAAGDSDAFTGPIDFPSDSTNITQVGGTTLSTSGPGGAYVSETVWNWGSGQGSSGGISTVYAMPSYQKGISMSVNQGSMTMRNTPDVALTGDNVYVVYNNGTSAVFGGTSCAAPLWAGFTALMNQQAANNGRAAVGFLNPALYQIGKSNSNYTTIFHDVTSGNNFSPSSPSKFSAVAGYDLCAGWGTPNGTNLINALVPLNQVLVLGGIPDATILEKSLLTFTNSASGGQTLTYSLSNAPAGAAIGATSGVFTWTPTEVQGPSTNRITVLATDNSVPPATTTQSFTVTVLESNEPPVLAPIANRTVHAGMTVAITNSATDPDIPANSLSFSLTSGPAGAGVNSGSGVFLWTPDNSFADTTNSISVTVTDYNPQAVNSQHLTDSKTFRVVVVPPPSFSSSAVSNNAMSLAWSAIPGQKYRVQYTTNLAAPNWTDLSDVTASSTTAGASDSTLSNAQRFYRVLVLP